MHIGECLCLETSMAMDYGIKRAKVDKTGKRE